MAQISSISQVEKYEKERAVKAAAKAKTVESPKAEAKAETETKEGGKK